MTKTATVLDDTRVHVKIRISALWASLMFCFIYMDFFSLYQPGTLQDMLAGKMGPLGPTTQGILLGTTAMVAIPSVMIFLSLVLRPGLNRWLNIILGVLYTLISLSTIPGAWAFYISLCLIEATLAVLVVWSAWTWPRQDAVRAR